MALDVLASLRTTAVIAVVAASASTPVVFGGGVSDLKHVGASLGLGSSRQSAKPVQVEPLVVSDVAFAKPVTWDRKLGAADAGQAAADGVGTVVTTVCPQGAARASCTGGTSMTFVSYSGQAGHALPDLTTLASQMSTKLPRALPGYRAGSSTMRTSADGTRYLDTTFAWRDRRGARVQRVSAYRSVDGSGLVVLTIGPSRAAVRGQVDTFLASAQMEPSDASTSGAADGS